MNSVLAEDALRQAISHGTSGIEDSMYPSIQKAVNELLPSGFEVRVLTDPTTQKPDLTIIKSKDGSAVAHLEVKLPDTPTKKGGTKTGTILEVFKKDPASGKSQAQRYRAKGVPLLLTDVTGWYDITTRDDLSVPIARFDDTDNEAAMRLISDVLHRVCKYRPQYRSADVAVLGIAGVITQINLAPFDELADGWNAVRSGLGLKLDQSELDGEGAGEVVAFTLLAIATQFDPLPKKTFVDSALKEWNDDWERWSADHLPGIMARTFSSFRDVARQNGMVAESSWVTIRAIAEWVNESKNSDRWGRLSDLWDTYLDRNHRRRKLGSWQTEKAVADYQAAQIHAELLGLGYPGGLMSNEVTIIDPCVGTGVYLESVIDQITTQGGNAAIVNAASQDDHPRLLGVDISSTAVAASHIRLAASGATPTVYMTDTLATGASPTAAKLFTWSRRDQNSIVEAARWDHTQVDHWARRDDDRDPVLAIIGNPPYEHAGLDIDRYEENGWATGPFTTWGIGSGGRGALNDPYVAFWAWAINLCSQDHEQVDQVIKSRKLHDNGKFDDGRRDSLFGVVSFISNRTWIEGRTHAPMRHWVSTRAASIDITDFGPGSRAGGAGSWSDQPFDIETGTAIVTLVFNPSAEAGAIRYRKGYWTDGEIDVAGTVAVTPRKFEVGESKRKSVAHPIGDKAWTRNVDPLSVTAGLETVSGIKTGFDDRWIKTVANRAFDIRHAYRAFDNRWSPGNPPEKVQRSAKGEPPIEPDKTQTRASADWRRKRLFGPHTKHVKANGWYAVVAASNSNVRPGPAIHPTRFLPDNDFFRGSYGGSVIRIGASPPIPSDYSNWAGQAGLTGDEFWKYAVAVGHHADYWTDGTEMATQLAERRVELPQTGDPDVIKSLVDLGDELVSLWSLDDVNPVKVTGGPGRWKFSGHNDAETILINGRKALHEWRKARPEDWDRPCASEYARSVAAILRVREIADEVADLLL